MKTFLKYLTIGLSCGLMLGITLLVGLNFNHLPQLNAQETNLTDLKANDYPPIEYLDHN